MNKWPQRFRSLLTNHMTLPSDITLNLPRITVIGDIHVYIENHEGLVVFTESELTVKSHHGFIQIKGSSFVLKMMIPKEILLEGKISNISYLSNE